VGVSGGDAATSNFILGGNTVEAIVTDYQGKCFEEEEEDGSGNELIVGLHGYISARR